MEMMCFRLKIWSTLIEGKDHTVLNGGSRGRRRARGERTATRGGHASVSNAPLATKRRAGTEGRFNCAFGPGLYYQPGLKGGGGRRARALKTPLVTAGNTDRDQRPLPDRFVGCHGPLVPARDTRGTDVLDKSPVFYGNLVKRPA